LLAEIDAVSIESKDATTNLRHVILRSSMGVSTLESVKGATSVKDADVLALARMGGEESIRAISKAEEALEEACSNNVGTTIVRLGALTDDAGGVPLAFGTHDSLLRDLIIVGYRIAPWLVPCILRGKAQAQVVVTFPAC